MGCACSRRRHSAHIRRLMTPPPCVIDRSAFLGSRSPPSSRQPARTRRVECAKSSERESRRLARFTSAASLSPGSDCGRCGAHRCGRYLGSVFFFLLKKKRTYRVRCSVRDHRRLSRFLRPSCNCFAHESMCKTVAGPAVVAGSRRSPAVLRRRSSSVSVRVHTRLHLPTTSTPIFTVTGRGCMAQWWVQPASQPGSLLRLATRAGRYGTM